MARNFIYVPLLISSFVNSFLYKALFLIFYNFFLSLLGCRTESITCRPVDGSFLCFQRGSVGVNTSLGKYKIYIMSVHNIDKYHVIRNYHLLQFAVSHTSTITLVSPYFAHLEGEIRREECWWAGRTFKVPTVPGRRPSAWLPLVVTREYPAGSSCHIFHSSGT